MFTRARSTIGFARVWRTSSALTVNCNKSSIVCQSSNFNEQESCTVRRYQQYNLLILCLRWFNSSNIRIKRLLLVVYGKTMSKEAFVAELNTILCRKNSNLIRTIKFDIKVIGVSQCYYYMTFRTDLRCSSLRVYWTLAEPPP